MLVHYSCCPHGINSRVWGARGAMGELDSPPWWLVHCLASCDPEVTRTRWSASLHAAWLLGHGLFLVTLLAGASLGQESLPAFPLVALAAGCSLFPSGQASVASLVSVGPLLGGASESGVAARIRGFSQRCFLWLSLPLGVARRHIACILLAFVVRRFEFELSGEVPVVKSFE